MKKRFKQITTLIIIIALSSQMANGQVYRYMFEYTKEQAGIKGIQKKIAIASDAFVNKFGDLTNDAYIAKSEVLAEEEMVKRFYFEDKLLTAQRNYTIEGELVGDEVGVAIYEYLYDANKNLLKIQYFDEEKEPFQISYAGPAMIEYKYDDKSNRTEAAYYDITHHLLDLGTSVIKYVYDDNDHLVEEKHFDSERELLTDMAPIIKYNYDNGGKLVKQSFHNAQHEMVNRLMDDDDEDVAYISFEYNGGSLSVKHYYNKEGKLLGSEKSDF